SGVAANGPSMAQCGSIGIHADCPPNQRQNSAFTRVAIGGVLTTALKKRVSAAGLFSEPNDLAVTTSA
ncbi:hypothetical protein, partial [Pseudomonas triticifolii]|uniref:hypothetical protein n=1 Tax=Pseudomonas triticifolii TaxID=2762592 RepID=UPI001BE3FEE5